MIACSTSISHAELRRDMDRLRFVKQQIKEIETTRAKRLAGAPNEQRHAARILRVPCLDRRASESGQPTAGSRSVERLRTA